MSGPVEGVAERLEATAARFVRDKRLPGAAVGVVHKDELAWSAGVGFADVASGQAPEASTLYRIASITKTFTGTAILQLRDERRLHLDDPVVEYIPELRDAQSPFGPIQTVTIRRLLSHESGLASEPPGTDWSTSAYEGLIDRTLERRVEIGTTIPPNAQQKYSNLGYQLLGEIVARVSGVPYVDRVSAAILEPLGMAGTFFEPLPAAARPRCATGYAARWLTDELDLAKPTPTIWAEGGLWSCVEDLGRWIAFQLRENVGPHDGTQVLDRSSLKEMHTARYLGNEEWTEAWGISWYAVRKDDVIWVQHSGLLHGFATNVCFEPKQGIGAIALVNGIADASALSMELGALARTAVVEAGPTIEPPATMPSAYTALLGLYALTELGGLFRLEWRDGKLCVVDPDEPTWRPTLSPTDDPDVFMIDPGVRESGELATFLRTPQGRVRSLFLAAATLVRLDPVE